MFLFSPRSLVRLAAAVLLLTLVLPASAGSITVVAAADLKFALGEIVTAFQKEHPNAEVAVVFGSSGLLKAQIENGAPFDLFFSADIAFPRDLSKKGLTAGPVQPYALGRIVLWSATQDASKLSLANLADPQFQRIAIANPKHAPYGQKAEEALRAAGVWSAVEPRLVLGENVSQTAQFVQSGNAQIGIIALSLALNPQLGGRYSLIPQTLHSPLEQGYVVLKRAASNPLSKQFADYMTSKPARAIMIRYGFVLPGDKTQP